MAVDAVVSVGAARTTVAELVARLEAGVREVQNGEGWRAYLAAMSRFHQYAAGNILLILAQKPAATRLAGFHTWLRLGRHVKRGERGIRILAPVTARRQAESEDDDEPDARTVLRWRVVPVFDYSQTEGTDLPPHPCQTLTTDSERGRWLFARLLQVARAEGIEVRADIRGLGTAHGTYVPGTRVIALAPGLSDDQRAKTLAHELGHALLLHGHGDPRREEEEAEAEVVALVVTTWAGLDTSGYSFGYVADWVGRKDGAALVRRVGATVQKAAAAIIRRLAPEETNESA